MQWCRETNGGRAIAPETRVFTRYACQQRARQRPRRLYEMVVAVSPASVGFNSSTGPPFTGDYERLSSDHMSRVATPTQINSSRSSVSTDAVDCADARHYWQNHGTIIPNGRCELGCVGTKLNIRFCYYCSKIVTRFLFVSLQPGNR